MTSSHPFAACLLLLLCVAVAGLIVSNGSSGNRVELAVEATGRLRKPSGNAGHWTAADEVSRLRSKWWRPRRSDGRGVREEGADGGNGGRGDFNTTDNVTANHSGADASASAAGWSEWSAWDEAGPCSTTCNDGLITILRTRSCAYEHLGCSGDDAQTEIRPCNNFPCLLYGTWEEWSPWATTGCSVTCSIGVKVMIRRRLCDPSTATVIDLGCVGPSTSTFTQSCKVAVPCGIGQPDVLAWNATTDQAEQHSTPVQAIIIATLVGVPLTVALLCSIGALAHAVCVPQARRHAHLQARCGGQDAFGRLTVCRCARKPYSFRPPPPPCCAATMAQLSRPAKQTWDTL